MDLSVADIEKSFGRTPVINGVNLKVPSGSLTAILGPSGCGKTTLLRLIAGFDRPDAGTIRLGERVLYEGGRSLPPERRQIGYVVQEGALFPHLTVAENITFGLPRQHRRDGSTPDRLLKLVGLEPEFAGRYPHQLSGGQQQRVALARALAPEPRVILLDEPFSSLDTRLRESTRRAVLQTLAATNTTAIMVTHDQAEALSMADQVAVMHAGRFIDVAPPAKLYLRPVSPESARSTGEAIILPATVRADTADSPLGRTAVYPGAIDGTSEIMVRPEQISLVEADTPGSVSARVNQTIFYGHEAVISLELPSGAQILARSAGFAAPLVDTHVGIQVNGPVHVFDGAVTPVPATATLQPASISPH
jgi:iron(III) transport system ATP-binding protein